MLKIRRITGAPAYGGTHPVWIVANNDQEYLLKFRDDGNEKDISIFNELVAYKLATYLKNPYLVSSIEQIIIDTEDIFLFEDAYRANLIDSDALNYAKASVGINIAVAKINKPEKATKFTKVFQKSIANIDNYLINRDRYKENTNVLYCKENKQIYVIDFGLSLLEHRIYEKLLDGEYSTHEETLLQCDVTKDERYLFKNMARLPIEDDINTLTDIILKIIEGCPTEWGPVKFKKEITALIASRMLNKELTKNDNCPFELF